MTRLALGLATLAATCLCACSGSSETGDPAASSSRSVPWSTGLIVGDAERSLELRPIVEGACGVVNDFEAEYTETRITITLLIEELQESKTCGLVGIEQKFQVDLDESIKSRQIVDGHSGDVRTVGRG